MGIHRIKILDAILADSEADIEAVLELPMADSRRLCDYDKGTLVMTAGTETGACDFTVDSIAVSYNGTDYTNVQTGIALQFTAAGVQSIAMSGSYGLPTHIKLLVTAAQVTESHYFATFTAELQFSTNSCCG